jgi:shikimate dehydrogenase
MEQYGLIGYPLGHSFSRRFFNEEFFPEHGIEAEYLNFEIPEADGLLEVVRTHPLLRGLNCTIPHKQAIIPLLDEISPEAREIGAVNVIRIRDGRKHPAQKRLHPCRVAANQRCERLDVATA